ncbi:N-acetylmuramic acid 6-phosphate etherase, partial [Balneolaceae bacterium ANBcel3]|nr:N-acetylmuramic acid 6-phosphate etherase [Balneolaceae bacterium ANBcel3]
MKNKSRLPYTSDRKLYEKLNHLDTEQRNPESWNIDLADPEEIVRIMNGQDRLVAECVALKSKEIAVAIDRAATALSRGGRIIYVGAGTSGRLGVIDAAECPPTFGTDPGQVVACIAGGPEAVFQAQEGVEDRPEEGMRDMSIIKVTDKDIICGLAASGRTPYVLGALEEASRCGAETVMVCCVGQKQLDASVKAGLIIDIPVGPEVIMGSTRLKSATAQKMVCNMITTGAMIRLGKIYENVMVDLMLTNEKLVQRAIRILSMLTGLEYNEARAALEKADGNVKTVMVMVKAGVSAEKAKSLLSEHEGFI